MQLIDWLKQPHKDIHNIHDAAKAFGVTVYAVRKWISKERTPRPQTQVLIKRVTHGAVTAEDWLPQ